MNPIYILDPHLIPVGLEALVDVDHILIKQHIETLEFLKSIDAANKYSIMVPGEHLILHAEEHSNFFARNLIGKSRGFNLKVLSLEHKEIFNVRRAWKCNLLGCCSPKCLEHLEITTPEQDVYGTVVQIWKCSARGSYFAVKDQDGEVVLRVQMPSKMACCSDMEFEVVDESTGAVVGEIRKKWAGFAQEMFTQADNFGVTFPVTMNVKHKALLISVCFLIVSTTADPCREIDIFTSLLSFRISSTSRSRNIHVPGVQALDTAVINVLYKIRQAFTYSMYLFLHSHFKELV